MHGGTIDLADLPGGLDLYATLESGQSYGWRRADGRAYEGHGPASWKGASPWYERAVDGEVLRVRQRWPDGIGATGRSAGVLEWEATAPIEDRIRRLLRLGDDLPAILDGPATDGAEALLSAATSYAPGMRLVQDPPFETLIAFICSTQMRVPRIHGMVSALAEAYGDPVTADGHTVHAFPDPETLAAATEPALRDLGLGYRAPYVRATAELVADGELTPAAAAGEPYEDARERLTGFVGVGEKVADCVLLFSLGYLEAVPLDTWIRSAIAEHFPDCDRGSYAETSRAIRERFGGDHAGYVQTYVFHYLRTGPEGS